MSSTLIHTNDSVNDAATVESDRLMAELSIARAGRHYYYDGYCYERLADAVAYAQLVGARQSRQKGQSSAVRLDAVESPDTSDRQLMLELSISFENGSFIFDGFRYDRLVDAVNYAHHRRSLSMKTIQEA